jgi:hypothetical protein
MKKRPYILGGILILFGYVWTMFRGCRRTIPDELMRFRRHDQMRRLKRFIAQALRPPWSRFHGEDFQNPAP